MLRSSSSSTLHSKAKPYSFRVRNRERVRERLEEVPGLSATLHLYLGGCELALVSIRDSQVFYFCLSKVLFFISAYGFDVLVSALILWPRI